jgi:hypothetical protein
MGTCYKFTYTPVPGGKGWGGVYWQYPANNWGDMPGLAVPSGATKVTFWAKGGAGGETLEVDAGGIQAAGKPNQDTFKAKTMVTLTKQWAQYTIPLPSMYGPVLGGLAWAMGAGPITGMASFQIDSMQWQ